MDDTQIRRALLAADNLPPCDDLTFRRVPIEHFSLEQVRKMLSVAERQLSRERRDHMNSVKLLSACVSRSHSERAI